MEADSIYNKWVASLKHVGDEGRTMIGNICSDALLSILEVKEKINAEKEEIEYIKQQIENEKQEIQELQRREYALDEED